MTSENIGLFRKDLDSYSQGQGIFILASYHQTGIRSLRRYVETLNALYWVF